eukprot:2504025-Pleurochrysis_carterae.AAC.3
MFREAGVHNPQVGRVMMMHARRTAILVQTMRLRVARRGIGHQREECTAPRVCRHIGACCEKKGSRYLHIALGSQ